MFVQKPESNEFNSFYQGYIDQAEEGDLLKTLSSQIDEATTFLDTFKDHGELTYAEGKWSVKQLIQHVIDAERVFQYRILRLGRGDETPLPGFDENDYAGAADVDDRSVEGLIAELVAVRSSTYALVLNLAEQDFLNIGTASGSPVSVRALCYITVGHLAHHLRILEERYAPLMTA